MPELPVTIGTLSIPVDQHSWLARGTAPARRLDLELAFAAAAVRANGSMVNSYMDTPAVRAAYRYWFWRYRDLLAEQNSPRLLRWLAEPERYGRAWRVGCYIGCFIMGWLLNA